MLSQLVIINTKNCVLLNRSMNCSSQPSRREKGWKRSPNARYLNTEAMMGVAELKIACVYLLLLNLRMQHILQAISIANSMTFGVIIEVNVYINPVLKK